MGGVEAADVEGRVGLGVAEPLRFGEADVERQPVGLHARKNVIAGAVEYAGNAAHRVAGQPLAQGLDDGNAAADRAFERQRRAVGFGEPGEFEAVGRDHRLVGGDDRQAARQRGLRRLVSRPFGAADQFDEDVDVPRRRERRRIVVERRPLEIEAAIAPAAGADRDDRDFATRARGQSRPAGGSRQADQRSPDDAEPREADT